MAESLRRPGKGELGDLDHDHSVEAPWEKKKDKEIVKSEKKLAKAADRKVRNKGRH